MRGGGKEKDDRDAGGGQRECVCGAHLRRTCIGMKHLDAMLLKEVADGGLVQDGQGTKFALLDHDGLIYMYDEECEVGSWWRCA